MEKKGSRRKPSSAPDKSPASDELSEESFHDLLKYRWSKVISLSYMEYDKAQIEVCIIDKTELEKPVEKVDGDGGKDGEEAKWSFQFCPEQFDDEIDLEQFQPKPFDQNLMK